MRRPTREPIKQTRGPLRACITAIDSARRSGIATFVDGDLWHYGELVVKDRIACEDALRPAIEMAVARGLPHALVIEVPWNEGTAVAASLRATVDLWKSAWEAARAASQCSTMSCVFECTARQWRAQLFRGGAHWLARDKIRPFELEVAKSIIRDKRTNDLMPVGGDSAAAICIGSSMVASSVLQTMLNAERLDRWLVRESPSEAAMVYPSRSSRRETKPRLDWEAAFRDGWDVQQGALSRTAWTEEEAEEVHRTFQDKLMSAVALTTGYWRRVEPAQYYFDSAFTALIRAGADGALEPVSRDCALVHGVCLDPAKNRPYVHAWIAWGADHVVDVGLVDFQRGWHVLRKDAFYSHWRVRDATIYTFDEMVRENEAHRSYGPWKPEYQVLLRPS